MSTYLRYTVQLLFRRFFLFLTFLFGFYLAIDLASKTESIKGWDIAGYYAADFYNRAYFFLPFATVLAALSVYLQMNQRGELTALLTSGLSKRRATAPAFILAGSVSLFLLFSEQYGIPEAQKYLDNRYQEKVKKKAQKTFLQSLNLNDGSFLIYSGENHEKETLKDVYWIPSWDDIWHFNEVSLKQGEAQSVHHYRRDERHGLFLKETFAARPLPWLGEEEKVLLRMQPSLLPLLDLIQLRIYLPSIASRREPLFSTFLLQKTLFPLLPIASLLFILPFALVFRRKQPVFAIYAGSILGFVALSTWMDAALFLSKRGAVEPFSALFIPFLVILTLGIGHYSWKVSH